jgi:hypothetical protein
LSVAEELVKLPDSLFQSVGSEPAGTIAPYAIYTKNNNIYFGLYTSVSLNGVWVYDILKKSLKIERPVASGSYGTNNNLKIYSISPTHLTYVEASTAKIDYTPTYNADSYGAFFISPAYQVGLPLVKATMSQLEIILDRPLTTGQGVRVYYRTHMAESWGSPFFTFDYSTYGGVQSYNTTFGVSAELIQFKVELTTGASSTTTPYLKEIRLR